jgi:hypothetical protein
MVTRPKLFVWKRRLQKERPQLEETVPDSSAGKNVFCSSDTILDARLAPKPNLLQQGDYSYKGPQPQKMCPRFKSQ